MFVSESTRFRFARWAFAWGGWLLMLASSGALVWFTTGTSPEPETQSTEPKPPFAQVGRQDNETPVWSLTFMRDGIKHVERIPPDGVDSVRQRVEQARQFKEAIAEIFTANAQLLGLQRDQARVVAKKRKAR